MSFCCDFCCVCVPGDGVVPIWHQPLLQSRHSSAASCRTLLDLLIVEVDQSRAVHRRDCASTSSSVWLLFDCQSTLFRLCEMTSLLSARANLAWPFQCHKEAACWHRFNPISPSSRSLHHRVHLNSKVRGCLGRCSWDHQGAGCSGSQQRKLCTILLRRRMYAGTVPGSLQTVLVYLSRHRKICLRSSSLS